MTEYTTYDHVIDSINQLRETMNQTARKQFLFTYSIVIVLVIILSGLLYSMGLEWYVPLSVMGSSIFLMIVIYLIAASTRLSKLKNEHLNQELIHLYNTIHEMNFDYEYKAKIDKTFNQEMGLFTRHASVNSKFVITSDQNETKKYQIYRCTLTTSDGKTTTVHFDGFYARIPKYNIPRQQLRSKGKAHIKGIKMIRLEDYEERIYVPDDQSVTRPNALLYSIFQNITRTFNTSSHYVASDMREVAIAISLKDKFKLPKVFDYNSLQTYSEPLFELLQFIDDVAHQIEEGEYL